MSKNVTATIKVTIYEEKVYSVKHDNVHDVTGIKAGVFDCMQLEKLLFEDRLESERRRHILVNKDSIKYAERLYSMTTENFRQLATVQDKRYSAGARVISRNLPTTEVQYMCFDIAKGDVAHNTIVIDGNVNEKIIEKTIKEKLTDNEKFIMVESLNTTNQLYVMTEQMFILMADTYQE